MSPQMKRRTFVGAGVTLLVSFLAMTVANGVITAQLQQRSDRELCEVITTSLIPRPTPPTNPAAAAQPTSQFGRDLQAYTTEDARISRLQQRAFERLAERKGCDGR